MILIKSTTLSSYAQIFQEKTKLAHTVNISGITHILRYGMVGQGGRRMEKLIKGSEYWIDCCTELTNIARRDWLDKRAIVLRSLDGMESGRAVREPGKVTTNLFRKHKTMNRWPSSRPQQRVDEITRFVRHVE